MKDEMRTEKKDWSIGWLIGLCLAAAYLTTMIAISNASPLSSGGLQVQASYQPLWFAGPLALNPNGLVSCLACSGGGSGSSNYVFVAPLTTSGNDVLLNIGSGLNSVAGQLTVIPGGTSNEVQYNYGNALTGNSLFTFNSFIAQSTTVQQYGNLQLGNISIIGFQHYDTGCSPYILACTANIEYFDTPDPFFFAGIGFEFDSPNGGMYFIGGDPIAGNTSIISLNQTFDMVAQGEIMTLNNTKGSMVEIKPPCASSNNCKGGSEILGSPVRGNLTIIDGKSAGNSAQLNLTNIATLQVNGAGNDGLSETVTVQNSLTTTCTMIYTVGILTGGTCT